MARTMLLLGLMACGGPAFANSPLRFGFMWVVKGPGQETQDGAYTAQQIAKNSPLKNTSGISSDFATGNVDVVVHLSWLHEGWQGTALIEAFSARSHQPLFSAKAAGGYESEEGQMLDDAFSPGQPGYDVVQREIALQAQQAQAAAQQAAQAAAVPPPAPEPPALAVRARQTAAPERLALIQQAEKDGDKALSAGTKARAFSAYRRALEGPWSDDDASGRCREKLLKLVAIGAATPDAPADARRHSVRARTFLKDARGAQDYALAATEYMDEIANVPWQSSAYYNLGLVQEQQGFLEDAMGNLKLYLIGSPKASDAQAVQDKVYALEARIEKAKAAHP